MDTSAQDLSVTALYTGCLSELIDTCERAGTLISRQDLYSAWSNYLIDMGLGMAKLELECDWLIPPTLQPYYRQSRDLNAAPLLVEYVVAQIQPVLDSLTLGRVA